MVAKFIVVALAALLATGFARPQEETSPYYGLCQECIPSPNNCDITAPCSSILGNTYCGCRPGYRAGGFPGDVSRQWRLNIPGHEHRVWVAPGVSCDHLCNNPFGINVCGEVSFNDQCKA
ncbi:MAG: hypothetical protein M1815_001711 [Lichina confinis]|nr:MAG: hypothetical protein M1815_001711 [Lichina confinis]